MKIRKTKLYKTFSEIKKIASHHYGESKFSIIKFLYYSFIRVNTFSAYKINLDANLLLPQFNVDEYRILNKIDDLISIRSRESLPREFYCDETHGVNKFYLLVRGEDIVYIHWVFVAGDKNRFLYLGNLDAELNYNTTMEKYRGKGIMNQMMRYILLDLRERGFRRAFGVVNIDNYPAIKSMDKCGFTELTRIKTLGPFNRKLRL